MRRTCIKIIHTAFSAHIQTRYSLSRDQVSDSVSIDSVFTDGGLQSMWDAIVVAHFKALFFLELKNKTVRIVIGPFGIQTR